MFTQTNIPTNKPLLKVINMMPVSVWLQYKWLNSRTTTSVSASVDHSLAQLSYERVVLTTVGCLRQFYPLLMSQEGGLILIYTRPITHDQSGTEVFKRCYTQQHAVCCCSIHWQTHTLTQLSWQLTNLLQSPCSHHLTRIYSPFYSLHSSKLFKYNSWFRSQEVE